MSLIEENCHMREKSFHTDYNKITEHSKKVLFFFYVDVLFFLYYLKIYQLDIILLGNVSHIEKLVPNLITKYD